MANDGYGDFLEARIKHLDMVQSVIARLGSNGFVVKGWAVTVAGAFLGFGITRENSWLALAGVLPTCLFWFLDASFLRSERAFRILFEHVRRGRAEPFSMDATSPAFLASIDPTDRATVVWWAVLRRPSLSLLYGTLVGTAVAVAVLLAVWGDRTS